MCLQMNFLAELHSSSFHWPCSYPTSSPQSCSLKLSGWPPIQFLAGGGRGDFLNFIYVYIYIFFKYSNHLRRWRSNGKGAGGHVREVLIVRAPVAPLPDTFGGVVVQTHPVDLRADLRPQPQLETFPPPRKIKVRRESVSGRHGAHPPPPISHTPSKGCAAVILTIS